MNRYCVANTVLKFKLFYWRTLHGDAITITSRGLPFRWKILKLIHKVIVMAKFRIFFGNASLDKNFNGNICKCQTAIIPIYPSYTLHAPLYKKSARRDIFSTKCRSGKSFKVLFRKLSSQQPCAVSALAMHIPIWDISSAFQWKVITYAMHDEQLTLFYTRLPPQGRFYFLIS